MADPITKQQQGISPEVLVKMIDDAEEPDPILGALAASKGQGVPFEVMQQIGNKQPVTMGPVEEEPQQATIGHGLLSIPNMIPATAETVARDVAGGIRLKRALGQSFGSTPITPDMNPAEYTYMPGKPEKVDYPVPPAYTIQPNADSPLNLPVSRVAGPIKPSVPQELQQPNISVQQPEYKRPIDMRIADLLSAQADKNRQLGGKWYKKGIEAARMDAWASLFDPNKSTMQAMTDLGVNLTLAAEDFMQQRAIQVAAGTVGTVATGNPAIGTAAAMTPLIAGEAENFYQSAYNEYGIPDDVSLKYTPIYAIISGAIENVQALQVGKLLGRETAKTAALTALRAAADRLKSPILYNTVLSLMESGEEMSQQGLQNYLIQKAIEEAQVKDPTWNPKKDAPGLLSGVARSGADTAGAMAMTAIGKSLIPKPIRKALGGSVTSRKEQLERTEQVIDIVQKQADNASQEDIKKAIITNMLPVETPSETQTKLQDMIAQVSAVIAEQEGGVVSDTENQPGIPSEEQGGETAVQAQPVQEASTEETAASGVVQAPQPTSQEGVVEEAAAIAEEQPAAVVEQPAAVEQVAQEQQTVEAPQTQEQTPEAVPTQIGTILEGQKDRADALIPPVAGTAPVVEQTAAPSAPVADTTPAPQVTGKRYHTVKIPDEVETKSIINNEANIFDLPAIQQEIAERRREQYQIDYMAKQPDATVDSKKNGIKAKAKLRKEIILLNKAMDDLVKEARKSGEYNPNLAAALSPEAQALLNEVPDTKPSNPNKASLSGILRRMATERALDAPDKQKTKGGKLRNDVLEKMGLSPSINASDREKVAANLVLMGGNHVETLRRLIEAIETEKQKDAKPTKAQVQARDITKKIEATQDAEQKRPDTNERITFAMQTWNSIVGNTHHRKIRDSVVANFGDYELMESGEQSHTEVINRINKMLQNNPVFMLEYVDTLHLLVAMHKDGVTAAEKEQLQAILDSKKAQGGNPKESGLVLAWTVFDIYHHPEEFIDRSVEDFGATVSNYEAIASRSTSGRKVVTSQNDDTDDFESQQNMATGDPGTDMQFIGPLADISAEERSNLEMAQAMLEKGMDRLSIYSRTGWMNMLDGTWRFHIPSSEINISKEAFDSMPTPDEHIPVYTFTGEGEYDMEVWEWMEKNVDSVILMTPELWQRMAPTLYALYKDKLDGYNIFIAKNPNHSKFAGSIDMIGNDAIVIAISANANVTDTLAHELQHMVDNMLEANYREVRNDPVRMQHIEVAAYLSGAEAIGAVTVDDIARALADDEFRLSMIKYIEQGNAVSGTKIMEEMDKVNIRFGIPYYDTGTNEHTIHHGGPNLWQPEPGFPHGRPRLDKIGEGENTTNEGWGFYCSDLAVVAQWYKENIKKSEYNIRIMFRNDFSGTMKKIFQGYSDDDITIMNDIYGEIRKTLIQRIGIPSQHKTSMINNLAVKYDRDIDYIESLFVHTVMVRGIVYEETLIGNYKKAYMDKFDILLNNIDANSAMQYSMATRIVADMLYSRVPLGLLHISSDRIEAVKYRINNNIVNMDTDLDVLRALIGYSFDKSYMKIVEFYGDSRAALQDCLNMYKELKDRIGNDISVSGMNLGWDSIRTKVPAVIRPSIEKIVKGLVLGISTPYDYVIDGGMVGDIYEHFLAFEETHRIVENAIESFNINTGYVYKLELPDDVLLKLLDWNAPMDQQPEFVQRALANSEFKHLMYKEDGSAVIGRTFYIALSTHFSQEGTEGSRRWHGGHTYTRRDRNDKAASMYLHSLGILGDMYWNDGGAGQASGVRNYVIWDQDALDRAVVMERNGELLADAQAGLELQAQIAAKGAQKKRAVSNKAFLQQIGIVTYPKGASDAEKLKLRMQVTPQQKVLREAYMSLHKFFRLWVNYSRNRPGITAAQAIKEALIAQDMLTVFASQRGLTLEEALQGSKMVAPSNDPDKAPLAWINARIAEMGKQHHTEGAVGPEVPRNPGESDHDYYSRIFTDYIAKSGVGGVSALGGYFDRSIWWKTFKTMTGFGRLVIGMGPVANALTLQHEMTHVMRELMPLADREALASAVGPRIEEQVEFIEYFLHGQLSQDAAFLDAHPDIKRIVGYFQTGYNQLNLGIYKAKWDAMTPDVRNKMAQSIIQVMDTQSQRAQHGQALLRFKTLTKGFMDRLMLNDKGTRMSMKALLGRLNTNTTIAQLQSIIAKMSYRLRIPITGGDVITAGALQEQYGIGDPRLMGIQRTVLQQNVEVLKLLVANKALDKKATIGSLPMDVLNMVSDTVESILHVVNNRLADVADMEQQAAASVRSRKQIGPNGVQGRDDLNNTGPLKWIRELGENLLGIEGLILDLVPRDSAAYQKLWSAIQEANSYFQRRMMELREKGVAMGLDPYTWSRKLTQGRYTTKYKLGDLSMNSPLTINNPELEISKGELLSLMLHYEDPSIFHNMTRETHRGIVFGDQAGAKVYALTAEDHLAFHELAKADPATLPPHMQEVMVEIHTVMDAFHAMFDEVFPELDAAYFEYYGKHLDKKDLYFRSFRWRDRSKQEPENDTSPLLIPPADNFLKKRTGGDAPYVIGDGMSVFLEYMEDSVAFFTKDKAYREAKFLLKHSIPFKEKVEANIPNGRTIIAKLLDRLDAWRGVVKPSKSKNIISRSVDKIFHNAPPVLLFGAFGSLVGQIAGVINATAAMTGRYKASMLQNYAMIANPLARGLRQAIRDRIKASSPLLHGRFVGSGLALFTAIGANKDLATFFTDDSDKYRFFTGQQMNWQGFVGDIELTMMKFIKLFQKIDQMTVMAAYMTAEQMVDRGEEIQQLTASGLPQADLLQAREQLIAKRAEEIVSKTQASWDDLYITGFQEDAKHNQFMKMATLFMSQPLKNMELLAGTYKEWRRGESDFGHMMATLGTVALADFMFSLARTSVREGMKLPFSGDDDEREDDRKRALVMMFVDWITATLGGIPVYGQAFDGALRAGSMGILGMQKPIARDDVLSGLVINTAAASYAAGQAMHSYYTDSSDRNAWRRATVRAVDSAMPVISVLTGKPFYGLYRTAKTPIAEANRGALQKQKRSEYATKLRNKIRQQMREEMK